MFVPACAQFIALHPCSHQVAPNPLNDPKVQRKVAYKKEDLAKWTYKTKIILSQHTLTWGNGILGPNATKVSEGAPASGAGACCWSASGAAASDQCSCANPPPVTNSVGVATVKWLQTLLNDLKCPYHVSQFIALHSWNHQVSPNPLNDPKGPKKIFLQKKGLGQRNYKLRSS